MVLSKIWRCMPLCQPGSQCTRSLWKLELADGATFWSQNSRCCWNSTIYEETQAGSAEAGELITMLFLQSPGAKPTHSWLIPSHRPNHMIGPTPTWLPPHQRPSLSFPSIIFLSLYFLLVDSPLLPSFRRRSFYGERVGTDPAREKGCVSPSVRQDVAPDAGTPAAGEGTTQGLRRRRRRRRCPWRWMKSCGQRLANEWGDTTSWSAGGLAKFLFSLHFPFSFVFFVSKKVCSWNLFPN